MSKLTEPAQVVQNFNVNNIIKSNDASKNYCVLQSLPTDSTENNFTCSSNKIQVQNVSVHIFDDKNNELVLEPETGDGKETLEEKIIQVISAGNVENLICIDSSKNEYSIQIPDEMIIPRALEHNDHLNDPITVYKFNECDVCGRIFRKKSNLKRHYRSHTGDFPHQCDQCDVRFPTRSRLKEHLHAHTGLRPHGCGVCGKTFSRVSNLNRHIRTHSSVRPYVCSQCDARFFEASRLREHYLTHVGEKQFACEVCDRRFLKKYNLKRHWRTHTGEHPFVCNECGRVFSNKKNLVNHAKSHGNEKSEADVAIETVAQECVVQSSGPNMEALDVEVFGAKDTASDQENKIFSCPHCNRLYVKEENLRIHLKGHKPQNSVLKCPDCDVTFSHASRLKEHQVTHSGEKQFACGQCDRRFGRNSNLVRHLQTHKRAKRFTCNFCERQFSSNLRLKEHLTSHNRKKRPLPCNLCNKSFRHKGGLQRHLLVHSGEKVHHCGKCDKRFNREEQLAAHLRRHHQSATKLPNRIEPRLMNIIQNLEARLCEPEPEPKNKERDSKEFEEITFKFDSCLELRGRSLLRNTPLQTNGKTGRSKAELDKKYPKRKSSDNVSKPKYKTRVTEMLHEHSKTFDGLLEHSNLIDDEFDYSNVSKATCDHSNASKSSLEQNNVSKDPSYEHSYVSEIICEHSNLLVHSYTSDKEISNPSCVVSVENQVDGTPEKIEIDDVSVYQTQVIGDDLDTIVLIKNPL